MKPFTRAEAGTGAGESGAGIEAAAKRHLSSARTRTVKRARLTYELFQSRDINRQLLYEGLSAVQLLFNLILEFLLTPIVGYDLQEVVCTIRDRLLYAQLLSQVL